MESIKTHSFWVLALCTVFVGSVAFAACIIVSETMLVPQTHSHVSRPQADMRSIQIAIESYYADCSAYPACSFGARGVNAAYSNTASYAVPTFAIQTPDRPKMYVLTTPIQYMSAYPADLFAPAKGASYAYWVAGKYGQSWIIYSAGPDGKYDLVPWEDYDPTQKIPSDSLINHTFDPTNGTNSGGDVYKYKN